MKVWTKSALKIIISLLLLVSLPAVPVFAEEVSPAAVYLTITQPSAEESVLAEGRDFYVWGNFSNPSDTPVNIKISLVNEDGKVVRMIQSEVNESGVTPESYVNMDRITDSYYKWGGVLAPDLIELPGGYANAENKLLVTDTYYHGMIQGGATKDMGTYFIPDENGDLKEIEGIITAGKYKIVVEAFDVNGKRVMMTDDLRKNMVVPEQSVELTFGLTNASLGLFRPENTKQKLIEYAKENNRRTYFDWFPGYFQMGSGGYEIRERWQPNNAIEVVNYLEGTLIDNPETADNTLTVYHVGVKPATYQVELAIILTDGYVDSEKTTFLYYDIGEPDVTWRNAATGKFETLPGTLKEFPKVSAGKDSRIRYTHADISAEDNLLSPGNLNLEALNNSTLDIRVDKSPYNVKILRGENVIFYGVTRPIEAEVLPLETSDRGIPQDQIITFTYTNEILGTFNFPGKLNRTFIGGFTEAGTNYEFGHLFDSSVTENLPYGKYKFTVAGYDGEGNFVKGTEAEVSFTVCKSKRQMTEIAMPEILRNGYIFGGAASAAA
ncbi:MAG: hypothetical protein Q4Q53_00430 [Methanocorpusculum sp.]|nr:hypothetical protein [Methanocorpusculum sp.]